MAAETIDRKEDGFEFPHAGAAERTFYRWHVTDTGKDLMLIDRFTGMPVAEFFDLIEDNFDRGRAPILLALLATSIRNGHPDWSVERIVRDVQGVELSKIEFIDADAEAQQVPPAEAGPEPADSTSPSDGSSSSLTLTDSSPTPTSSETPPSSTGPGSPTGSQGLEALTR